MTGLTVWAALSVVGLAALLTASATAFTALKLAGGVYLVYLGLHALWRTRHRDNETDLGVPMAGTQRLSGQTAYRQGLLSNLLNPKVGVFYTTLLPQLVAVGESAPATLALLGFVHILLGAAWLTWYAVMVVKAGELLRRPVLRR